MSARKNAVSRLFADIDEVVAPTIEPARPEPKVATEVPRVDAAPAAVTVAEPNPTHPSRIEIEDTLDPVAASPEPAPAAQPAPESPSTPVITAPVVRTATKHKVEGVKTRRARGKLSGFRAAMGVQLVLQLPSNLHAAYTRRCAGDNVTLQDGVTARIRELLSKAATKPEVLVITDAEAEKLVGWVGEHGTGHLRLVVPREVAEGMDSLPFKETPDGEPVSRRTIATRAVLDLVRALV